MSRDMRKGYYNRDWERERVRDRDRDRDRDREYRRPLPPKRSHSPHIKEEKRRSRSPPRIKGDKDMLDENILSEISKLPEPSELWEPNQFQDSGFAPPPPFQPPEVIFDIKTTRKFKPCLPRRRCLRSANKYLNYN